MNRKIGILISLALMTLGIVGAVNIVLHGEHVMGTTNEVPWGVLISGYEYFVGISTGLLLVASVGYIFNYTAIKMVAKTLVMLAVFTMFGAFAILLIELGNPINMYQYFLSPNFASPIWWMAPLYSTYLILLLMLLYYVLINDEKKVKLFASLTSISAIIALINIGFLFGFLNARPYWNGPFSTIYFVVTAFFSGIALAAVVTYFRMKQEEISLLTTEAIRKLYLASILVVGMMVVAKIITKLYGGVSSKADAVMAFLTGPLSFNFWTFEVAIGLVLPLLIILFLRSPGAIAIAGFMSLVGILFMRVDMVIAGQIKPLKIIYGGSAETSYHAYTATWSEWSLIVGAIGISLFLYFLRDILEKTVKAINKQSAA